MILFTADIHIKLGQKNVPVDWAKNRYRMFFEQLYELEKKVDLHILGGDIYDRLPTPEEQEIFSEFLTNNPGCDRIMYDGNHEANKKHKTFFTNLTKIYQAADPRLKVVTKTTIYDNFIVVPYCELKTVNYTKLPKLPIFTHVRGEIPPHVKPEIDLSKLDRFPIVFAGDLHSHSNTQRNIVYPGSPMTIGFHRKEVNTGYLLIDENTWDWEWKAFELPQLIRKTVDNPDNMIPTDYHHTIYELEGDMVDLSQIKNKDLLDKKLVSKNSEATLQFDSSMDIDDELAIYLKEVLKLSDLKIEEIMVAYYDYT